ncbi:MAG: phosphoglucosamine mutase [Candidatus Puniceispirillum sp.]|nr:phosphoglucosamine mutase [Candidatus Puniceispirillum sp.]MCA0371124.1 phosphoglucosamine mutase [Pseudomonadota bacterium]
MAKLFGTDGIRGRANIPPMTPDMMTKIAIATARHLRRKDHRHLVVIGKDTRLSGYMIEPALTAGFIAMGMDVMLLGPVPTPAVSMLVPSLRADIGVMISASHNPHADNGIKMFDEDGRKLSLADEEAIEALMQEDFHHVLSDADTMGKARRLEDASGRYIEAVKRTFPEDLRLDGLRIVVDCAHGAAYRVAPAVFWELGAEVIPLGIQPSGQNINQDVGATSTRAMQDAVVQTQAHLGISLDGDADRLIMADETGRIIDGDQVLGLIASSWKRQGRLTCPVVVGTVMANLGLAHFLTSQGITLERANVGDKYVAALMDKTGAILGGEPSGHIILSDYAHTGDGIIAALQVLAVMCREKAPLSQVAHVFEPVPQILRNVRLKNKKILDAPHIKDAIAEAEERLGKGSQLLVRPSGTEPLVRIMGQCMDEALLTQVIGTLSAAFEA